MNLMEAEENSKCVKCGKPAEIYLSIDDKIKGLKVEKLILACKDCARKSGVKGI